MRTPLLIAAGGLLLGVVMGALILVGLPFPSNTPAAGTSAAGTPQALGPAPVSGAPAPDFGLQDLAGNTVKLADAKGHPALINFWATWCLPCRDEMPAIEARYQAHKDKGLLVYAVDFDEPAQDVQDFAKAFNLSFHVLLDPGGKVNDQYRILAYPTSFFVDSDGVIQVVHIGSMTPSAMDDYLTKILP
jgi:peroxiredoxin